MEVLLLDNFGVNIDFYLIANIAKISNLLSV